MHPLGPTLLWGNSNPWYQVKKVKRNSVSVMRTGTVWRLTLLYRSCGTCCEVYLWKTTWTLWRTCTLTVQDTRSCPNLRLLRTFRSNPILRLIPRRGKSTWPGSKSTLSRTGVLKQGQGRVWSRRSRLSRPGIRGNTRTLAPRMRTRRNLNVIMNWLKTGTRDIKFLRPEQD